MMRSDSGREIVENDLRRPRFTLLKCLFIIITLKLQTDAITSLRNEW